MRIIYAREFVKQFNKLPEDIQTLYKKQEELFLKDWRDSRLHVKQLTGHPFPFSFRITRVYRVLFVFTDEDTALFATVGHRKGIYR